MEYPWSSYAWHAEGKADPLITDHDLYVALGSRVEDRLSAYRDLFAAHIAEAELNGIRDATNKGWVLGDERFKEEVAAAVARRISPLPRGRPRGKNNRV